MIDEYQDTNELQYEIFLPILNYLKRGNLFVVGDEKQSIYMFRDAELEVFDKTKELILSHKNGKVLILPDSFRMGPEISLFTNYIFSRLFSGPDLLFNEVSHSDLVCARQEIKPGGVSFLLSDEENNISEADLISSKILELKSEDIQWSSIAILSRKRKSFDELEESFINHNIPYLIMGGRNFYQRQSIYDIYNYFAFLLDNCNDAALAGILRSPFFGISDSVLYEISLSRGSDFYHKLLSTEIELLEPVKVILKKMITLAKFKDAPEILREILETSDFISCLAAKKNGTQEIANIKKLISITIDFYSHGFRTLYDYLNFLKTSIEQTEDESQALVADDSNTVKIMTIHQAKGLEYPVVFLYKCSDSAQKSIVKQKSLVVNKKLGILTKVPLDENYYEDYTTTPVVNLNNFISLKKSQAELKRLLYVGVTRAKDYLYITAAGKEKHPADSFMGLLLKALGEDYSPDGFCIKSGLTFLNKSMSGYSEETREMILKIPVDSSIREIKNSIPDKVKKEDKVFKNNLISDSVKGEMISATKYSVFNQCPLKYKFTYLDSLLPLVKDPVFIDESSEENDNDITSPSAGTKGRIIHKILQEKSESPDISYILSLILREDKDVKNNSAESFASEIKEDLDKYYLSETFKSIRNSDCKNEYEVYLSEKDYFLFGIIDKLIVENEKITIIDYKTDDIPEEKVVERGEEYFNQLKFYSYIIWNIFNHSCRIICRLIFIKHPDKKIEKEIEVEELLKTGEKISAMVENTRNNNFQPDFTHCKRCIYSKDHINCIKRTGK
jgi:ATP-dependent helicase/nuclease subunit A